MTVFPEINRNSIIFTNPMGYQWVCNLSGLTATNDIQNLYREQQIEWVSLMAFILIIINETSLFLTASELVVQVLDHS